MYIIWHVFVSYMSADSFRGVTGIWICGVNQMPRLGPRFRFSPSCLFLVKVVTKMGLVILLWQAQKKQTTLQNTETSLGQNSPLTEAVDSPQCGLGSISAMIEPWIEKPSRVSPFSFIFQEAPLQHNPSWQKRAGASSPPESSPCLPSQCMEGDRHSTAECVYFQTGSPEPPFSVLN